VSQATALLADAETSIKAGEWDQALEQLESLKIEQPSQPEVYERLAHVLAVRGKFQSVITTYLELIKVLVEADSLQKADAIVATVLALRPESGEARERRIEIENKRGNTARAVYLSRELARLCIDQGDGERSIRLLQDALKHEPSNLDIALELAEMFVSHGHIQDGANQYRKVANAFQEAGNISKAAEAYRRMKVVQSDDPEVLLTLGRLYTELGKLDEAEQEFRSVLRHDLDHEQALLQLGLVCQLKGRFRSGILAFNKVLQNNPNLVSAKRKLGELHYSQGMMTEAVDFFLQAAQGHLEADEKDDAIECFQIVLSVDENNAPAQQGLTNLGAPVQPRAFEAPQPPTPPVEEAAAPEAPPPPVPFPAAMPSASPEPVGGAASERTERLQPIDFDSAAPTADPGPPKPEATSPKRPSSGSLLTGGASGGPRKGLSGGLSSGLTAKGLISSGGDKPMLGGDRPTLGRPGMMRQGLNAKSLGGGMAGPGGDKPMLGASHGDRRPSLSVSRSEPAAPAAAPAAAPPPAPSRPSFADSAPLEDFSADMALDDVFADPPEAPAVSVAAAVTHDDDFALPDAGGLFDEAPSSSESLDLGQGADLFAEDDPSPAAAAPAPTIGDFQFDSDEDGGGLPSTLRPAYAGETPVFEQEPSDDIFDFDADSSTAEPSAAPTLQQGGSLFDDGGPGEDLFGDSAGGADDLFGGGGDLFADEPSPPQAAASAGLFDDAPAAQEGLFDGDSDPFALFEEPAAVDQAPAVDTIGGSLGETKPAAPSSGDFFFDDETPQQEPVGEASFGSLFEEPAEPTAPPSSSAEDLFGGGDDLFSEAGGASVTVAAPAFDKDGLFGDDSSDNLFGEEDLFNTPAPQSGLDEGLGQADQAGAFPSGDSDDLFSGSEPDSGFVAPRVGLDAPLDESGDLGSGDLFGSDEPTAAGLFESPAADDGLFGEPDSGQHLFAEERGQDGSLFEAPIGLDDEHGDFMGNGTAPVEAVDLFEAAAAPQASGGLFDELDSGSDTIFEGFSDDFGPTQPAAAQATEPQDEGGLFSSADNDDLFGGDGGLFGDEPVAVAAATAGESLDDNAGDLFGDFSAPTEEQDDIRLPLGNEEPAPAAQEDLFAGGDDGSLFGPFEGDGQADPVLDAPHLEEPEPINIPSPSPSAEPVEPEQDLGGDLFGGGDGADGFFGGAEVDEPPPPLDLDLPMPGDAPMLSESAESEPVPPAPLQAEPEPSFDFGADGDLFGDQDGSENLFGGGDGYDVPLEISIPEPSDEPLPIEAPQSLQAETEPEPNLPELAMPAPQAEPEPEPEEQSPELISMLELTLPKAEEEPSREPEPEPIAIPEPAPSSGESLEIPVNFDVEEDIFEPSLELRAPQESEPLPFFEEPAPVEPDPVSLLSAEEQMEIAQTAQADALEASMAGADVASKIGAYRKALEEHPDNLVLRTRLADIHLKYGLLEDAVVQYRQVMRRNPDSIPLLHRVIQAEFWNENYTEAGDSLLALAHLHLKRGEQHEALDTLQSILSLDPLHFEARKELVSVFTSLDESKLAAHHLRQLAETALTKGEVSGAILAFQQLLEISEDPTFEERLAQIYESQGDVDKALSSFRSLVGRYRAEERWEEAARVTERIVELAPDQLDSREELITLYQRLGHAPQAVEQQFLLARAYQERRELERAIGLYEDVLKFQTDNHDARRHLVDAYLDAGRVPMALEQAEALTEHYLDTKNHATAIYLYSRLVEADPENVELQERLVKFYGLAGDPENAKSRWIHISQLHEAHGRYDRAAEAVQKALELDENQIELQHRLALLYAERLGDNQAALGQLRKLFQMAPERIDAVKMYIDLLLKEEQVSEAGQVLQRLEQAGGEGVEIKTNVIAALRSSVEANPGDLKARFNYGELCYHLGDLDHAIEQFQQTRRHPDYELMSYNMLGLCFASKRGYMMLDLAIKQFQKGLESKGRSEQDYLEIRYNLAMVQYQNGRLKEALAELKECYNVDIAYRDVRSWIQKIEGELATSS
jgi:tetratricopeptide (TPR) repeat protein